MYGTPGGTFCMGSKGTCKIQSLAKTGRILLEIAKFRLTSYETVDMCAPQHQTKFGFPKARKPFWKWTKKIIGWIIGQTLMKVYMAETTACSPKYIYLPFFGFASARSSFSYGSSLPPPESA